MGFRRDDGRGEGRDEYVSVQLLAKGTPPLRLITRIAYITPLPTTTAFWQGFLYPQSLPHAREPA